MHTRSTCFCGGLLLAAGFLDMAAAAAPDAWQRYREAMRKDPSVVAYYTFEDVGDGTAVADLVRGDGALSYAASTPSGAKPQPCRVVEGRWPGKTAVRLDQGALVGPTPKWPQRQFTVMLWTRIHGPGGLRGNSGATNGTLFAVGNGYWDGLRLTTSYPAAAIQWEIGRPKPSHSLSVATPPLVDGVWRHVAAAWDGRQMRLFIDGALRAARPFEDDFTSPADKRALRIGFAGAGVGSVILDVDEAALIGRALSAEEVVAHAFCQTPIAADAAASFAKANQSLLDDEPVSAADSLERLASQETLPAAFRQQVRLRLVDALLKAKRPRQAGQMTAELLRSATDGDSSREALALGLRLFRQSPGALPPEATARILALPEVTPNERAAARLHVGHARLAAAQYAEARTEYAQVAADGNAAAILRGMAQLRLAESYVRQRDFVRAKQHFVRLIDLKDLPPHFYDEARQRIEQADRLAAGKTEQEPLAARTAPPRLPEPSLTLYVAPQGADTNPGTQQQPLATLQRARDELRRLKAEGKIGRGGAAVVVAGGTYSIEQTFELAAVDSGTAESPIVYRAADGESPVFSGGVRLKDFQPIRDASILARLPEEARGKVFQTDVKRAGVADLKPLLLTGYASGLGFKTRPVMELFFNGKALPLARWPNEGFVYTADAAPPDPAAKPGSGSKAGWFRYEGDRPRRWQQDKDLFLYGYWCKDWADSYERVASIDLDGRVVRLAEPYHRYGYRKDQRYCAVNLLSEIDQPGEWYLDRTSGLLYVYPPSDPNQAVVELSTGEFPFVSLDGASHVVFRGLTWQLGSSDAVLLKNCQNVVLVGCTVRHFAGSGVEIQGGTDCGLLSCDIYSMGRGGATLAGGNRKTLAPGKHFVENCHIHHLSRIDHTYTPAVRMSGVGHRVAHNRMHDINSSAINMQGNDHLIELNEVYRVVLESDDQGGLDSFGNPTFRGNVLRYNYWHHVGNWRNVGRLLPCGAAGIRLDDAISGTLLYGNVFFRSSGGRLGFGGVQIHGGKENLVDNNVFVDCVAAISLSPWGEKRWHEVTAKSLDAPEIDKALYLSRYPGLAHLADDHDVNTVSRNLVYRCGEFLRRDRGRTQVFGNHVTEEDCGFVDPAGGDFRLKDASTGFDRTGLTPIPFAAIGLYRDEFRKELPARYVEREPRPDGEK